MHEWYPYLEGYSPDFVSNVIETFAPNARDILDPFCGSGTTALVTAMRGGVGYYSEVNPACQYVIEAKAHALTLSVKERSRIADRLHEIAGSIHAVVMAERRDDKLARAFEDAFGERPFFETATFEQVLKVRALADKYERDDPLLGRFFVVGVLRSLVPFSK